MWTELSQIRLESRAGSSISSAEPSGSATTAIVTGPICNCTRGSAVREVEVSRPINSFNPYADVAFSAVSLNQSGRN